MKVGRPLKDNSANLPIISQEQGGNDFQICSVGDLISSYQSANITHTRKGGTIFKSPSLEI